MNSDNTCVSVNVILTNFVLTSCHGVCGGVCVGGCCFVFYKDPQNPSIPFHPSMLILFCKLYCNREETVLYEYINI